MVLLLLAPRSSAVSQLRVLHGRSATTAVANGTIVSSIDNILALRASRTATVQDAQLAHRLWDWTEAQVSKRK
jgi:hypothetical protein